MQTPLETISVSLRRERERAGLSLSELAKRAGIAKSTLSQLEAGSGNPSVETLWALGVALDVPFSRLVEPPEPRVRVIRSGEGPGVASEQASFVGTLLSSCPPSARRDIYVISLEPGSPRVAEPHMPGTVEHLTVAAGRLRAGPAGDPVDLAVGDYLAFPGDVSHVYEALDPGSWAVLVMEHT
ncbi:transcriptional regulator, XRE family with cupin sensor [Haloechinothrix alba]|uniref:Transcriptional regulator, XRE family with cupin sensor n=1 Tax=Haloechinothrix alba TaxID=664784 RepID=A0A238X0A4_9PSEU|nr:XRE family transcriptional regulator [Haloechinothrix alba]SNR51934.1 transcriptional regulator, XRE family with cupin sensor [Haloechinothrix alba]